MKKLIFFVLILGMNSMPLMAQEQDPWVGTWSSESYKDLDSESEGLIYSYYRYIIKITKNENGYFVRAKTVKVSDPQSAIYNDAYGIKQFVKETKNNTMTLETRREKIPFYVDGQLDSYSNTTSYFKLTLNNGVLHFSLYRFVIDSYDRKMQYEYTTTYGIHEQYSGPCIERDLFNDEW